MNTQEGKKLFSLRLKKALQDCKHPISPTYLSNEFNHRYDGQPISVQSANNWLLGKAIPNQDKLSILSIWLNVSAQWLRFGEETDTKVAEQIVSLSLGEQINFEYFTKYKRLTLNQKQVIQNLIDEFSILNKTK